MAVLTLHWRMYHPDVTGLPQLRQTNGTLTLDGIRRDFWAPEHVRSRDASDVEKEIRFLKSSVPGNI